MIDDGATISDDRLYRYRLWRTIRPRAGTQKVVAFVMLNPSTADATHDDPTIRRCMSYAMTWGYHQLEVVNLFAFRSAHPTSLLLGGASLDWQRAATHFALIVGPENDAAIQTVVERAELVVCAWGEPSNAELRRLVRKRAAQLKLPPTVHALAFTKDYAPRHPLYLKADLTPVPFDRALYALAG